MTAREREVSEATSTAAFATPFPAIFRSQMLDPRSGAELSRLGSVVWALFVRVFTFEGCGLPFNVTKMMCRGIETCFWLVTDLVVEKMMTLSLLVNAATYFLRLVVREATHSSTETTVAMETVSLTFVVKRGNFLQALKASQDR